MKIADAEISLFVFVDEDQVCLDFASGFLQRHLDIGHLAPAGSLPVRHEINFFAQSQARLERVDRFLHGGQEVGGAVAQRGLANDFAGEIKVERRLGNDALHDVGREKNGGG